MRPAAISAAAHCLTCRKEYVAYVHTSACRTNPDLSSGSARYRIAWEQGFQIWRSSRSSRRLCNKLTMHLLAMLTHVRYGRTRRCGQNLNPENVCLVGKLGGFGDELIATDLITGALGPGGLAD